MLCHVPAALKGLVLLTPFLHAQLNAKWAVKHPNMKPLHQEAMALLQQFDRWSASHVRRCDTKPMCCLYWEGVPGAALAMANAQQSSSCDSTSTQACWLHALALWLYPP